MISNSVASLASRTGTRQFVKFCLVGASSTALDLAAYNLLLSLGLSPALALSGAFPLGVLNGFFWNSRWTFRANRSDARKQMPKFFATNVVGWSLNLLVTTLALIIAAALHLTHTQYSPAETLRLVLFRSADSGEGFSRLALNAAKLCATVCVTAWNFTASKLWTFKA
jgi:putative flippase GtrA